MHLDSGDYFNTDSDFELQNAVVRLQSYAQTLRNKLETEKLWLASLKSETQLLLAQKGSPFPDGRHLPQCPMSQQASCSSLHLQNRLPSSMQVSSCSLHQQPVIPTSNQANQADYTPQTALTSCPVLCPDNFSVANSCQPRHTCNPPISQSLPDEVQKLDERQIYLQKLVELDNMCKQEMARITQVGYELEPLNQLASDWNFQAQLSNPKTSVKDYIAKVMASSNSQSSDGHLFVQTNFSREKPESDLRNFQSGAGQRNVNDLERIQTILDTSSNDVKTNITQKSNKSDLDLNVESPVQKTEVSQRPSAVEEKTPVPPKDNVRRKVILRKGVTFLPHKDDEVPQPTQHNPTAKHESSNKITPENKEKKSPATHSTEVAPIVWGRLAVDKKKKKLKQYPCRDSESLDGSESPSEDSEEEWSGDDTNSGHNHFASAVEREFLRKYMSSDSNFVYSPLFISESEDST